MFFNTLILSSLFGSLLAISLQSELSNWQKYKIKFNKNYENSLEESLRHQIFMKNIEFIENFNLKSTANNGHLLGINEFSDMTSDEIARVNVKYLNNQWPTRNNTKFNEEFLQKILNNDSIRVPDSFDWRQVANRVRPVRSKHFCTMGSYAFAAVALLEGQLEPLNKTFEDLSPQNIVDCQLPDGMHGCSDLSTTTEALQFIIEQGGIADEETYPFNHSDYPDQPCKMDPDMIRFTGLKGISYLPEGDEEALKKVVSSYGPVAATIDGSGLPFITYKSGVYYRNGCKTDLPDIYDNVLIVGYGTDPKEGDYWIIRLPYGETWGEEGYMRLARNKNNCCGIATNPLIATF